ncbi:interleukin-1 receptor accessory protein isoform X3 [Dermochelys coriacea]|uniref:interleukin-1 receptor accessory protein isoform X3 n=1 Tax=Dermochelys coriacea TaxID=27794 RepID=UPI0018E6E527|nr:interleukin-1 receptor accessory protein isoform X3 [Dermochelys coriacea]
MKVCRPLLITLWLSLATLGSSSECCDDWGVDTMKLIQVYDGEPARIKCPLFEAFLKYNYTTAHSAGLTLIWYWIGQDRDQEELINFRLPDNRISKEKDTLWFRPALLNDTGNYTCMLRNTTSKVVFPLEVVQKDQTSCISQSIKPTEELFYLEHTNEKIICPDIDGFYPPSVMPTVNWYRNCVLVKGFHDRYPEGPTLIIGIVRSVYKGNYTCIVSYKENGRTYNLTRTIRMKVVGSPAKAMPPQFSSPNEKIIYELEAVLVPRYTVELACGLGATVLLVVILIVVYHVYWLEMVLFYRARFGTDEAILDGKEYDIYVSYARNAEEEEFVLLTLRGVLENEFGYKLCIFDRDSLPGGIVTDETLSFIQKSRRLLVVLSPNYVLQGTQALLELKAGLENMASQGSIRVILIQYKAIKKSKVKELKRAKTALTVIKWKGEKSKYPRGRFWKQLQVEMPVKKKTRRASINEQELSDSFLQDV